MTFVSWRTGAEDRIWSLGMTPKDLLRFCSDPHHVLDRFRVKMMDHLVVTFTPVPQSDFNSLFDGGHKDLNMSPGPGLLIREFVDKMQPDEIYFAYGIAETGVVSMVGPPKAPDIEVDVPRTYLGRIDFDERKPNLGLMHGELPTDRNVIGHMIRDAICYPERWTDMLDSLSMPAFTVDASGATTHRAPIGSLVPHPHRRVLFEQNGPIPAGCFNGLVVIIGTHVYLVDQIFKLWK